MSIDAILFVGKDPWGEPQGGQTNFANLMLHAFEDRLAVVSTTAENIPLRFWCDRSFENKNIKFFNIGRIVYKDRKKPLIPLRYSVYRYAKKSMPQIYGLGVRNIFIDSPELLFAVANYTWDSVCYRFAGVNNPIDNSRYKWAKWFGKLFEKKMFRCLKRINVKILLASADDRSIDEMILRSRGLLDKSLLHNFPTRVDTDKIRPISKNKARAMLDLESDKLIIVTCGRLSWIKGWDLILNAVDNLKKRGIDFHLIFVGDGEDREKVFKKAKKLGIAESVKVTGFIANSKVCIYLNAADICVVASHREGWSLAMLEILACGKPLVSTDVSGAKNMISQGENGFIVEERNPKLFAEAILKALELKSAKNTSLEIAARYSAKTLAYDLASIWRPLSVLDAINSENND